MIKTLMASAAIVASLTVAASAQNSAQDKTNVGPKQSPAQVLNKVPTNTTPVDAWYKQPVYDSQNDKIGSIDGMLLGGRGKVQAVMVDVGGFVGVGNKNVAVPFDAIRPTKGSDGKVRLTMNVSKDALKSAPGFKQGNNQGTWVPLKHAS